MCHEHGHVTPRSVLTGCVVPTDECVMITNLLHLSYVVCSDNQNKSIY